MRLSLPAALPIRSSTKRERQLQLNPPDKNVLVLTLPIGSSKKRQRGKTDENEAGRAK